VRHEGANASRHRPDLHLLTAEQTVVESQAYLLIREMHQLVTGDGKRILSSNDIASLEATLHTIIVLYEPDVTAPEPHDMSEARRAPQVGPKRGWFKSLLP